MVKAETEAVAGSSGKPSLKIKLGGKAISGAASQLSAGDTSVNTEEAKPAAGAAKKARKAEDSGEKPARKRPKKGRSPEEDADDVRPSPASPNCASRPKGLVQTSSLIQASA